MLKIVKASAGSGKTHKLALEYIRLIVGSDQRDAYRHVLAVTFTNKATDEMKRRILKELHLLATRPADSPYAKDLVPSTLPSLSLLQERARIQLSGILNDYSAFAVSTIDRFFQQTLRAFSREIGLFASYQVQVDRESLLAESVDRLLDGLSEKDSLLLDWLTRSARENLQEKGKTYLEEDLRAMAADLSRIPEGEMRYDKQAMDRLRELCNRIIDNFPKKLQAAAQAVLDALQKAGIAPEDTYSGFMCAVRKNLTGLEKPSDAFIRRAKDPELWFTKANIHLQPQAASVLPAVEAYLAVFGLPYKEYNTARTLKGQLYCLGVARELREAFDTLQREKNILSLDDSNALLHRIIDGTDTPFIYEKMGVRYEDFLLDEFQDTSQLQWENFKPLLHASIDAGNDSLVVGDVKQSIYRFRGSDWELLGSRLEKEFHKPSIETLEGNWRTCEAITEFNWRFFQYVADEMDRQLGSHTVSRLYQNVRQQTCFKDPAPGSVEVCFTDDQLSEILRTIDDVRARGAQWSDITILVRGRDEGSLVASELVSKGYPVVSDDSLLVKSSVTVRRLVSQLSLSDTPPQQGKPDIAGYMAASLNLDIPEAYHSLIDLAESILRDLKKADPDTFTAEIPYIQSFMDYLQEWTATGGNNLGAFLRAWEDVSPKIASPASGNSIRVMTVHKSKGLEFPFVIVPFAEKVDLYKAGVSWSRPQVKGSALESEAKGLYRVVLGKASAETFFAEDYLREVELQAADAVNVFYVALTRAQYGLKVIAAPPPDKLVKALKKQLAPDWKNLSQLLYAYVGGSEFRTGEPYDFSKLVRKAKEEQDLPLGYDSFPADSGSRLRFSAEAADYFGEDGLTGPEASSRIRGNVLHGILSAVRIPEDLPGAVNAAVLAGELPQSMQTQTLALLRSRLSAVTARGWFSPQAEVRAETSILSPDGSEYRPDRVVLHPDGRVDIIDYKFGKPEEKYTWQVRRYVNLYRQMGHRSVQGYLWYLESGEVVAV